MFARYCICYTGYAGMPFVAGAIGAYVLWKQNPLLPRLLKCGNGPTTPMSGADLRWQARGCADGLTDYNLGSGKPAKSARFPQKPSPSTPAFSGNAANNISRGGFSAAGGAAGMAAGAGAAGRVG